MTITLQAEMMIEPTAGTGALEELVGTFEVDPESGTATLIKVRIGAWDCPRIIAAAMAGAEAIKRQESAAWQQYESCTEPDADRADERLAIDREAD